MRALIPSATFICGGEMVPASRYRVHPIASGLHAQGWETRVVNGYGPWDQRIASVALRRAYRAACRVARAARTASLQGRGPVMVQRLALPWFAAPEAMLARRGRPLVFDFDDAVFLGEDGRVNGFRRDALDDVSAEAAHVVAGNSWLAERVGADVPVTVIPTCIDTSLYVPPSVFAEGDGTLRIGWIGTYGNFPFLQQIIAPLAALRAAGRRFEFAICSDREDAGLFQALGATFQKWSPEVEIPFLQSIHIGLMPLADTDWCRGKCSFKVIQYLAVGCPVVASAVGMNLDVLDGERGGYLVRNGDWASPLDELLGSFSRRSHLGKQARHDAVQRFDIASAIASYRAIFSRLQ